MNRFFFVLPLALLSLLSLPQTTSDRIRLGAVSRLNPLWNLAQSVRTPLLDEKNFATDSKELQNLQLENHQLRAQLNLVYDWLGGERRLKDQVELFRALQKEASNDFLARRAEEMRALLQAQAIAAPARILYRDPSSWSSSCWINVGEENNRALGQTIIGKNSPVVAGGALVGIVEFVGPKQSRVRFITDSGLKTAVRAIRGSVLEREVSLAIDSLLDKLKRHPLYKSNPVTEELVQFRATLPIRFEDGYFAKGEVLGSSATYTRALGTKLKGIGFNCDVADVEGPARDLRDRAVLQEGDLLITSGLDGVFPPGLKVAVVSSISPAREGAYCYELEADPAVPNLADLTAVFILPPLTTE